MAKSKEEIKKKYLWIILNIIGIISVFILTFYINNEIEKVIKTSRIDNVTETLLNIRYITLVLIVGIVTMMCYSNIRLSLKDIEDLKRLV
jgi:hypothetical protein